MTVASGRTQASASASASAAPCNKAPSGGGGERESPEMNFPIRRTHAGTQAKQAGRRVVRQSCNRNSRHAQRPRSRRRRRRFRPPGHIADARKGCRRFN